jgi:uncharacterized protein
MSDEILESYIVQHIRASDKKEIVFSWHGGEPLMAGLDFFRNVLRYQKKYRPEGSTILNGIQTNGSLIDDEWGKFLSSEGFAVGLSIDGPEEFHNKYRLTAGNENSFNMTMSGLEILNKYGISPEILCVVSIGNVNDPLSVYKFLKSINTRYITFIPLVIKDPTYEEGVDPKSVPSLAFGVFLVSIFDEWLQNGIGTIKVQIIEEAIRVAFNQNHTLCIFKKICGAVPVVENNGDFFSCDHFVDREHFLGNITDKELSYYINCESQRQFGKAKSENLPDYCNRCDVLTMCNGECPKNRFISTPDGEYGLNYLCTGYKYFFSHCKPFIKVVADVWKTSSL